MFFPVANFTEQVDQNPFLTASLILSFRKLNPNYSGPCCIATNGSGSTQSINFIGDVVDTAALTSFGAVSISRWYDQSGNSNDAIFTGQTPTSGGATGSVSQPLFGTRASKTAITNNFGQDRGLRLINPINNITGFFTSAGIGSQNSGALGSNPLLTTSLITGALKGFFVRNFAQTISGRLMSVYDTSPSNNIQPTSIGNIMAITSTGNSYKVYNQNNLEATYNNYSSSGIVSGLEYIYGMASITTSYRSHNDAVNEYIVYTNTEVNNIRAEVILNMKNYFGY